MDERAIIEDARKYEKERKTFNTSASEGFPELIWNCINGSFKANFNNLDLNSRLFQLCKMVFLRVIQGLRT